MKLSSLCVLLAALGLTACDTECNQNVTVAPKPVESDPQFVVERQMIGVNVPTVYVIRDKVNGKLLYVTPKSGVAVEDEE